MSLLNVVNCGHFGWGQKVGGCTAVLCVRVCSRGVAARRGTDGPPLMSHPLARGRLTTPICEWEEEEELEEEKQEEGGVPTSFSSLMGRCPCPDTSKSSVARCREQRKGKEKRWRE